MAPINGIPIARRKYGLQIVNRIGSPVLFSEEEEEEEEEGEGEGEGEGEEYARNWPGIFRDLL